MTSNSPATTEKKRGFPPILVIFLTILVDMIGFGIVIPILPLYAIQFHATDLQIGILFGCFSLMQLLSAPLLGRLSDKIGRRPVLMLSILGTAISFGILGFANTLVMLFVGRLLDGASGGNISTAQAYIADVTPLEKRSGAMGIIGAAFGLGFVIGPAIGGWLGHVYGIHTPFLVAAGLALVNAIAIFLFLPESYSVEARQKHASVKHPSVFKTLLEAKNTALGPVLVCSLLSTMAFSLVTALFTLFTANRLGWHALENGNMFAYIGIIGILIQGGLIRRLAPKVGEKPLIIIGAIALSLSMFLLPLPIPGLWSVILAGTGLAIGNSLLTPMISGLASKTADSQSQGTILGLSQSVASFARMIGPVIGGYLLVSDKLHLESSYYGISAFWFAGFLSLLSVFVALRLNAKAPHTAHLSPDATPI